MKGFQSKALSSASEFRSSWLEEAHAFPEFLPTKLQHLCPAYLEYPSAASFLQPPPPFKNSCVLPHLSLSSLFLTALPSMPQTHIRVTVKSVGILLPTLFSLRTCRPDFLGNSFQLLQTYSLFSSPPRFHLPFPIGRKCF